MKVQTLFGAGRKGRVRLEVLSLGIAGAIGCTSATEPVLAISAPADFSAKVTQVQLANFNAPSGHAVSQYEMWVTIAPGTAPNAGVIFAASAPVFIRTSGDHLKAVSGASIRVGDQIEVWHDAGAGYGSAQAPPGAPAYGGVQVVIVR
jgi:hypothetical protein